MDRYIVTDNITEQQVGDILETYEMACWRCSPLNLAAYHAGQGGRYSVCYSDGSRIPWEKEEQLIDALDRNKRRK